MRNVFGKSLWLVGAGVFAVALLAGAAYAADGPFLGSGPYQGYYGWYWGDMYSFQAREATPYFSHHPPVYYSLPVPRTYGYTPFPYPPWVMTPEVVLPGPKVIQNRYVPHKAVEQPGADRTAARPLRIVNPYVARLAKDEGQAGPGAQTSRLAEPRAIPRPQVVHPAALAGVR